MALRSVDLPPDVPGTLLLGAMPARFSSWKSFEAQARQLNLALVVCLTPRNEMAELSPNYHLAVNLGELPFRWINAPMPNYGVPDDKASYRHDITEVAQALRSGESVMLHCAAGIGRTGSTAACVLKALGLDTKEALQRVRLAGSNPENATQSGFVDWF